MASDYRAAVGHGIALVSLSAIVPQPRTDATVQPVLRSDAVSGAVVEQGAYIDLLWSAIFTATEYQALLDQFGVGAALTANVTIYAPDHEYVYTRYNGLAVRPMQGETVRRSEYYIRDVTIRIKNLSAL